MSFRVGTPLIGRAAELAALEAALALAGAGQLRVTLINGDAGVGKTRLVEEFLARHRGGVLSLRARASPFVVSSPFELWIEALEGHLRSLEPGQVIALCRGRADTLAALLPSVAAAGERPLPDATPPRPWLLGSLVVLLSELAVKQPLTVFLDDLHLADPSSYEALYYVARNLTEARVLILATTRPGDLLTQPTLGDLLGTLSQDGRLETIQLQPLGTRHLADLARSLVGGTQPADQLVQWLALRSGGNALFAIGLLRALIEEGADLGNPELRKLPEDLQERVLARAGRLPPEARATLEVLAVLGGSVEPSLLQDVLSDEVDVTGSLARLVVDRLVSEHEVERSLTYEVSHPLVAEALYEGMRAGRRRALHRQAARALGRSGSLPAAALHYARSADPGDEEALAVVLAAAERAELQQAFGEALALRKEAARLLRDSDPRLYELLERLTWLAEVVQDRSAILALRRMERLAANDEGVERRVDVALRLAGFLYAHAGDVADARRELEQALQLMQPETAGERVLAVRNELAWLRGFAGDMPGQLADAAAVLAAARSSGSRKLIRQCLGCAGHAAALAGRFERAEAALAEGLEMATAERDVSQFEWNLAHLGFARTLSGRANAGAETFRQAAAGFRTTEPHEYCAFANWAQGNLSDGLGRAMDATPWSPAGLSHRKAWALGVAALCAAELGKLDEAAAHLARAAAVFGGRTFYWMSEVVAWAEGVTAWSAGDEREAAVTLERTAERLQAMGALSIAALVAFDAWELAASTGDAAGAARWSACLSELAAELATDFHAALAAPQEKTSARTLGAFGWRLHRARLLVHQGSLEASTEAAAELEALHAGWRLRRLADRLKLMGRPGRRAAAVVTGAAALSAREREVATLAARGLTSREIGERLFISSRTVETHLENAYAKLGLASKRELLRRGHQLGLIP